MRLPLLDGLRGFFLLFMTISHLNAVLGTVLGKLNYHPVGWADSAHGFVFLSGLTVGLVYTRKLQASPQAAIGGAILRRVRKVYGCHLLLVALMLTAAMLLAALGMRTGPLAPYVEAPLIFPLAAATLVTASQHMGILPMYVVFLLATPLLIRLLMTGHGGSVVLASITVWLLAQSGLTGAALDGAEAGLRAFGSDLSLGLYFDLAGWQAVYVGGLVLGSLAARDRLDLDWLRRPSARSAVKTATIIFVLLALLDRAVYDTWISADFSRAAREAADRGAMAPIYLIAVTLDVFLIAWLLVAGPYSAKAPVRLAAGCATRALTHPALTCLGRRSLAGFSTHIGVVYAVTLALGPDRPSELTGSLILIGATGLIYLPVMVPTALAAVERQWGRSAAAVARRI